MYIYGILLRKVRSFFVRVANINVLGVIGTGLAVWIFNLLIKETSSVFASSVTYLIPIVAIFWGVADGENFILLEGLFCAVIFTGVYLIRQPSSNTN